MEAYSEDQALQLVRHEKKVMIAEKKKEVLYYSGQLMQQELGDGGGRPPLFGLPTVYCTDTEQFLCAWCNKHALREKDRKGLVRYAMPLVSSACGARVYCAGTLHTLEKREIIVAGRVSPKQGDSRSLQSQHTVSLCARPSDSRCIARQSVSTGQGIDAGQLRAQQRPFRRRKRCCESFEYVMKNAECISRKPAALANGEGALT